ncbi:DUF1351 domain-containing protein [Streptococcus suis]|uniref:DUF1351 domain-containing protein n=1 Tax=Streptococcus suis TaxID=1307 RepID=UPI0025AFB057|nr:DUF1351 domain-containing protein [Streptococcus suis]MDN2973158.1 DUF1351 domain-containing protein [Streptococcus suis]MDN2990446.1 DUF1351 domain-containing protein [Streptococcus suis]MDN2992362.1 DUF1351 domain-containing protein [Streptococcus suis]MDN2994266.1 DUF1351 domain-containing protein [Streptococcus suis]MDN3004078.1 DUF1351 domain-containing protein [Streptococcus suis]
MSEELSLFDNLESMAPIPTATVLDFDFEFTPAQITIVGKDFLEQALTGYVEKYKNYIVTAETFEDDAKVRAELNTLQKKVKSAVKEKLADYNKPIDEVKAWVDGLLEPIVKISKSIDEGVKAFEEQERLKRAKTIEELFQKAIASTGKDIDIRLFSKYFDEFSKKTCFMADNIRPNKATVNMVTSLVEEEVTKREEYESALIKITEAAAKADFGPAPYVRNFEKGASLADILQAIADDKALADKTREEVKRKQQLAKRIEEMTAIAESKGLDPKKYADMLESGVSALAVHEELVNDARKWQEEQEFLAQQGAVCGNTQNRPNSDEIQRENMSEGKYTYEQKNASEDKIKQNKKVVKWQGDFRITFPDGETAKLFGGKGGLYEQHGIVVEKLGEWVKIND